MKKTFRLDIFTPDRLYDQILGLLAVEATAGWEEADAPGGFLIGVHADRRPFLENLAARARAVSPEITTEIGEYEEKPWREAWKEYFTPIPCGSRFLVLPPWLRDSERTERLKIVIEPAFAFGTGQHASTALCLRALDQALTENKIRPGQTFLDLGCGSGILGVAAALSGLAGVGLDIDPLAIANAEKNRELNSAASLELATGGVELGAGREFDLVMANILAGPLREMAPDLAARVAPGGVLILSGILDRQAGDVARAYEERGLPTPAILSDGEWRALVFERA